VNPLASRLERLCLPVRRIVAALVLAFFAYMLLAVLVQVLGRYLVFPIAWAAETATLAQIWMVLLAAGLAMRDRLHVSVDALVRLLPQALQRFCALLVAVAGLWFLSLALRGSLDLLLAAWIQQTPVLGLPMWLVYLSLPLGLVYFALELLMTFVQLWRGPQRHDSERSA
jgi:TRAP-type C4-dicarboxylate transport system permease small subunit